MSRYDEERDVTVLADGTPLVAAAGVTGTETFTKVDGERSDGDASSLSFAGTMTRTAIRAEREDNDTPAAWGGTELSTRRLPADVEKD